MALLAKFCSLLVAFLLGFRSAFEIKDKDIPGGRLADLRNARDRHSGLSIEDHAPAPTLTAPQKEGGVGFDEDHAVTAMKVKCQDDAEPAPESEVNMGRASYEEQEKSRNGEIRRKSRRNDFGEATGSERFWAYGAKSKASKDDDEPGKATVSYTLIQLATPNGGLRAKKDSNFDVEEGLNAPVAMIQPRRNACELLAG
ncbi:hypothetical protein GALMADRAFT_214397 [Galerina marginata CBS 339.88]|uniref:Uncharacterized protein n=1 Tax=Galerina marginata (strain CBS 339.88) TaxID=685588 RepID=A0A067SV49_GALM3|nr:hypothetical protein GALMADRAFT_214397 [Galerina marginata CBS 339.88]